MFPTLRWSALVSPTHSVCGISPLPATNLSSAGAGSLHWVYLIRGPHVSETSSLLENDATRLSGSKLPIVSPSVLAVKGSFRM